MKLPVLWILVASLLTSGAWLPIGDEEERLVPRRADARAQLEYAVERKSALRGREGEVRRVARAEAVAAYRAVRRYFPRDRVAGAEASLRAGELLRSGGAPEEALVEFVHARRLGAGTDFEARAGLEIGHVHRRARRPLEALTAYERVLADGDSRPVRRDVASYWAGRVHLELARPRDARRCFERVARRGADPVDRVRAFDAWAATLIDGADLEGAAGVLELCRTTLRDVALEETTLGQRVREALERMRSVGRLARAVEERRRRREGGNPGGESPRRPIPPRGAPRFHHGCAPLGGGRVP